MFLVVLDGPRLGDPLGRPGDFLIMEVFGSGLFFFEGRPRLFLGCGEMPDKMSWNAP